MEVWPTATGGRLTRLNNFTRFNVLVIPEDGYKHEISETRRNCSLFVDKCNFFTGVAIPLHKFGTNFESATVKLISLNLNVSLNKAYNTHEILHLPCKTESYLLEKG